MPLDIIAPERKTFHLERTDKLYGLDNEDRTMITVRQARVKQNSERSLLFAEVAREYRDDERDRVVLKLPMYALTLKEIYLTLVECNITSNGKPLFRFKVDPGGDSYLDMRYDQFVAAAGNLPESVLQEIHDKVLEVNPHWIMGAGPEDLDLGEESYLNAS